MERIGDPLSFVHDLVPQTSHLFQFLNEPDTVDIWNDQRIGPGTRLFET